MTKVAKTKAKKSAVALKRTPEEKSLQLQYLFEYGVNLRDRIITLTDEITDGTFDVIDAALSEMEATDTKTPITLRIKSPGGSVYDAIAIVGRLKASPCDIITEGYGMVMSAATIILASGTLRKASRFTWFMTHESAYHVSGKHSEIKAYVSQAENEEHMWASWMAELTTHPKEFWLNTGTHVDAYFDAKSLIDMGVIDEII
jgi:ATP-dependent Clp endopeptidase proteolytic subunit ClpP